MSKTPDQLVEKIDRILGLLAAHFTKDMKQSQQIAFLYSAGFQATDIAKLLGTTSNTVNVQLVRLRKSKKKKKG